MQLLDSHMRPLRDCVLVAHINYVYDNGRTPLVMAATLPRSSSKLVMDQTGALDRQVSLVSTWSAEQLVGGMLPVGR